MYEFSSTGQLVTLGLVDSSIGAMAKGLALVDVEALVTKDMLILTCLLGHRGQVGAELPIKHWYELASCLLYLTSQGELGIDATLRCSAYKIT